MTWYMPETLWRTFFCNFNTRNFISKTWIILDYLKNSYFKTKKSHFQHKDESNSQQKCKTKCCFHVYIFLKLCTTLHTFHFDSNLTSHILDWVYPKSISFVGIVCSLTNRYDLHQPSYSACMSFMSTVSLFLKGPCSSLLHTNAPVSVCGCFLQDPCSTNEGFRLLLMTDCLGSSCCWPFSDVWGHLICCSFVFQMYEAVWHKTTMTYSGSKDLKLLETGPQVVNKSWFWVWCSVDLYFVVSVQDLIWKSP